MPGEVLGLTMRQPRWLTEEPVVATGAQLMTLGVQLPLLLPESVLLLRLRQR